MFRHNPPQVWRLPEVWRPQALNLWDLLPV
jgi:hypothetical protein